MGHSGQLTYLGAGKGRMTRDRWSKTMHIARSSIYVCMLLDRSGDAIGAEIIEADCTDSAADRAAEMLHCSYLPAKPHGFELWHRGRKLIALYAS